MLSSQTPKSSSYQVGNVNVPEAAGSQTTRGRDGYGSLERVDSAEVPQFNLFQNPIWTNGPHLSCSCPDLCVKVVTKKNNLKQYELYRHRTSQSMLHFLQDVSGFQIFFSVPLDRILLKHIISMDIESTDSNCTTNLW